MMATISDLRAGIAQFVGGILYPAGIPASPNAASPVSGCPVRIFQGWPEREAIDADMVAGIADVSVYVLPGTTNTTRYPVVDVPIKVSVPTLSWTIVGTTAAIGGIVCAPQNVGLLVDRRAFLYAVQPADTLASIATGLAELVNAAQPASAAGSVVTIPNSHSIVGRVGGFGTTLREVGRQKVMVQIEVWAASEALRNAVGGAIESCVRDLRRLPLADCSVAMIWFGQVADSDELTKSGIYRRTITINAEYASITTSMLAQVLNFDLTNPLILYN
ncbi:MAG: hypothetical protein WCC64_03885 [Aliidongia sp.]